MDVSAYLMHQHQQPCHKFPINGAWNGEHQHRHYA